MENKDFVPYQESLDMKELGFDEPCLARQDLPIENGGYFSIDSPNSDKYLLKQGEYYILIPLYQQAFRWFREKHRIGSWIHHYFDMDKGEYVYSYVLTLPHKDDGYIYDKYEEAELACLKKLIEIVKANKHEQQKADSR